MPFQKQQKMLVFLTLKLRSFQMKEINLIRNNVRAIQLLLIIAAMFLSHGIYSNYTLSEEAGKKKKPLDITSLSKPISKSAKHTIKNKPYRYSLDTDYEYYQSNGIYYVKICDKTWDHFDRTILSFISLQKTQPPFSYRDTDNKRSDVKGCGMVTTSNLENTKGRMADILYQRKSYRDQFLEVEKADVAVQVQKLELRISKRGEVASICSADSFSSSHISKLLNFLRYNTKSANDVVKRYNHPNSSCTFLLFDQPLVIGGQDRFEEELNKLINKRLTIFKG
jgi:hypothetical protein